MTTVPAGSRVRGRSAVRLGRRLFRWIVIALVVATLLSVCYNAATSKRASRPAGLVFVAAGDVVTRYRTWGTTGSPVVLVPGAFETADTFAALGAELGTDHRVYALDLTGTGYSQPKAPFTVAHFASQVLAFSAALGLTGPNAPVLVGHSSGAAVAGLAAVNGGRAVAAVMFLDGDAAPLAGPSFLRYLVIDPYRTTIFRLGLRSDFIVRSIYRAQCGATCSRLTHAEVNIWRRPLQQPGAEHALWSIARNGIPSLSAVQLDALRASPVPKSVVFGFHDPQYSRATASQVAARIAAPPPTIVPGAHLTMIASPDQVATAIRALCNRAHNYEG